MRGGRHRRRRRALERHLLAGHPRRLRRRRAGDRLAPPPRARQRRRRRRAAARRRDARRRRPRRRHAGAGPRRRAARRRRDREGDRRRARAAARARRPPPGPRRRELPARVRRLGHDRAGERSILEPPFVCLLASGGHTLLARVEDHAAFDVLGRTLDDAAGEAFDKGARLLGLPFPGGPALEKLARDGDPEAFAFPIARGLDGLDFSFAGVKTSLLYKVRDLGDGGHARARAPTSPPATSTRSSRRSPSAASARSSRRARAGWRSAAASPPTARCARAWQTLGATLGIPPRELCTDNAAMIASAARFAEPLPFPELPVARRLRLGRARARVSRLAPPTAARAATCATTPARSSSASARRSRRSTSRPTTRCYAAYLERIPVVVLDGVELFEFFVDEGALREHLDRVNRR